MCLYMQLNLGDGKAQVLQFDTKDEVRVLTPHEALST